MGLHPTVGLRLMGAMPKFINFTFVEGAFSRRVLWALVIPQGLSALMPNVALAIYVDRPARK